VALCHKRAQLRRRRRDTLSVLLGAVVVTFAAALFTRSGIALAAQVLCDLALAAYVSLLVRAARASVVTGPARRSVEVVQPLAPEPGWQAVYAGPPASEEPMRLRAQLRRPAPQVATYVPAHALRQADLHVVTSDADDYADAPDYPDASYGGESYNDASYNDESYGDFDSYASLALATAR
jgi:hypothetical protein